MINTNILLNKPVTFDVLLYYNEYGTSEQYDEFDEIFRSGLNKQWFIFSEYFSAKEFVKYIFSLDDNKFKYCEILVHLYNNEEEYVLENWDIIWSCEVDENKLIN